MCSFVLMNGSSDLAYFGESFTIIILWLLLFMTHSAASFCSPGFYAVNSSSSECVPCSVCGPGEGTTAPCGGFNDTLCSGCRRGQFSSLTVNGRECMECESCLPQRTVSSPCTATQNSICGRCSEGYFLYVDNQGSECRRCSRCPVDRVVIHWIDCAEAGEPVDNQCAPGEWTPDTSSTVVVISTSTVKPTIKVAGKTRLPTDHGMFVPMATYQSKTSERPQDSQAPRNIAIVSIVFTIATSLAFLVAVGCLCRDKCCNSTCVKMIHRAKKGITSTWYAAKYQQSLRKGSKAGPVREETLQDSID